MSDRPCHYLPLYTSAQRNSESDCVTSHHSVDTCTPTPSFRIRYWYFKFYLDGYLYEHLLPAVTNNILWSIYNLLKYYWRIVFKKQCFIFLWLIMLATISRYIKLYSNDKIYLAVNDKHVCKLADWKKCQRYFLNLKSQTN